MTKSLYWLTNADGHKARVEGAEQRDRWLPLGWSVADEPVTGDMVYLEHEVSGGRALFPAAVVPAWGELGWQPAAPPEPVDLTKDPLLVDQPVAEPVAAPAKTSTATTAAKEK